MSYFSEKIKKLRVERGLTQKEVAEAIGISQGNYSGLEGGKFEPSLSTLKALSDFYNEFIDSLIQPFRIIDEDDRSDFTDEELMLVHNYRNLSDEEKEIIKKIIGKFQIK